VTRERASVGDRAAERSRYGPEHLAVIVPTKDRPDKVRNLLDSLCEQPCCGRIVVVDSGECIGDLVRSYADRLPVEHHRCNPPGQIRQRNFGISLLDDRTPLVASLDDDIVLEPGALDAMVRCWNSCPAETAGISFNIVNNSREPGGFWRRVFLLTAPGPGRVLRSGATTSNSHVDHDIRTQWLCGGASVWRLEILMAFRHQEVASRWAIAEDLLFSYPIGKRYPLYVCAAAAVRHEHQADYVATASDRFHGFARTIWLLHFVRANSDLSTVAFAWMQTGAVAGRLLSGLVTLNRRHVQFAIGQFQALVVGFWTLALGGDLRAAIERTTGR